MPSTSGSPTAATSRRDTNGVTGAPAASPGAETTPAAGVVVERRPKLRLAEVRPERVYEDELGVCELPEQEVRHAKLPGRPDQQIRVRHLRRVQVRAERVLVELDSLGRSAARRVDDLGAAA